MSNQPFNQFAAQFPPPAGMSPAPAPAPGYGPPMGPPMGPPPGPAPVGPAGFGAPMAPAGYAQPGPAGYAPGYGPPQGAPPAGPPQGYAPAPQQYAPQAAAAAPAGNAPLAFGAGAFAGAAPVSDRKDCQPGDYLFEISATDQIRDRKGVPLWKLTCMVVQAFNGAQTPNSEVNTVQQMGDTDQVKYAGAFMLEVSQAAFGCSSDHELRAGLQTKVPQGVDGWAMFADALQRKDAAVNQYFPANPLKGARIRVIVTQEPGTGKHQGKVFTRWKVLPAPRG